MMTFVLYIYDGSNLRSLGLKGNLMYVISNRRLQKQKTIYSHNFI